MNLEEIRQAEWYQNLQADRQSLEELGHQIVELALRRTKRTMVVS
jgi:hypothetical protein